MDQDQNTDGMYVIPQRPNNSGMSSKTKNVIKAVGLSLAAVLLISGVFVGVVVTKNEASNQVSAASAPGAIVTFAPSGDISPSTVRIKKGQAVLWKNTAGQRGHRVIAASDTASSSLPGFGSSDMITNTDTYSYVFNKAGTYYYYDTSASTGKVGTVIVTE